MTVGQSFSAGTLGVESNLSAPLVERMIFTCEEACCRPFSVDFAGCYQMFELPRPPNVELLTRITPVACFRHYRVLGNGANGVVLFKNVELLQLIGFGSFADGRHLSFCAIFWQGVLQESLRTVRRPWSERNFQTTVRGLMISK